MRVYIASPLYSSGKVEDNLYKVMFIAEVLIKRGHIPYIAHLNHYWNQVSYHPDEYWLKLDFEWLKVCDCVLRLDGYSVGADKEVEYAKSLNIPVYYNINDIKEIK